MQRTRRQLCFMQTVLAVSPQDAVDYRAGRLTVNEDYWFRD